ncbi:hypothetical protein [Psychroserpens sp.]|uniref:hypothetical protein n=1 Tax=Psychroserpens sp. TaxID=2020870 RepID=UPI002B264D5E|nr:hypothetical protein [Psychroserpens sp.]
MKKSFVILCLLAVLIGCKSETKKMNSIEESEVESISIIDTLSLKLNDGQKWIANIETNEGISKMDSIISTFKKSKGNDYETLGNNLAKQTGYVIKHCSMKGEPHDQLHVVLIPMLDEISVLREEDDEEKNKLALHNLEALISAYFEFFKV